MVSLGAWLRPAGSVAAGHNHVAGNRPVPEFEEAFELLRSELRHGNHVFGMSRSDPELLQGRHLAGERYALTALDTLAPLFGVFDLFRGCRDATSR